MICEKKMKVGHSLNQKINFLLTRQEFDQIGIMNLNMGKNGL